MGADGVLEQVRLLLASAGDRSLTGSAAELLSDLAAVEAIGRLVDARRVVLAGQVEHRSRKALGEQGLAIRHGARDGVELVAQVARVDGREAKRRVGLGSALAPRTTLSGDTLPGRHSHVEQALHVGQIGVDAARVVVEQLQAIRRRVDREDLDLAEEALVDTAKVETPAVLRVHAEVWALGLDPDGVEPADRDRYEARAFRLGALRASGLTAFSGLLPPEQLAVVRELLHSRRRGIELRRTTPGGDAEQDGIDPEWVENVPDGRSRTQQDFDSVFDVLTAGLRAEQEGRALVSATHEVVVHVSAAEVEARQGAAWTSGVLAAFPVPTVERIACTGGVRLAVTGLDGEPLALSRTARVFTPAQKKALALAAGGRCEVPGCTVPVPFLEAHHVRWWHRDAGATDVDNGILVCAFHHHSLHALDPGIRIVNHDGALHIVPGHWTGTPLPAHRRQRRPHPGRAPDPRAA